MTISPATGLLGTLDPDAGIIAQINVMFYRSITRMDPASYSLSGPYDTKTGHFRLEPKKWNTDNHPSGFEMVGIEGKFDSATETITAKMLGSTCDSVEIGQGGRALPPLPAPPSNRAADPNRPEMRLTPSNVTNYLDVAAGSPDFEYWVTAWSDPEGTVHEGEPIDEAVEGMKGGKWACVGSQHITWDVSGLKGTAPDQVGVVPQRYVIECLGECKGVFYRPWIGANVTHLGLSAPLPTFHIKNVWFGEMKFEWRFSRKKNTQPAPQIYVHRWTPLVGFGPFDPVPAEVARRQAEAPPCRAPKAGNK
uniref:Uncharacterized protein n=1 Tax=uncultured marine bacterium PPT_M1 TaxID=1381396 RepID=A0A067XRT7_9BACT|nr:hypothetical protein PPT_M1_01 [uncultured marine bacterium PPT_M1]